MSARAKVTEKRFDVGDPVVALQPLGFQRSDAFAIQPDLVPVNVIGAERGANGQQKQGGQQGAQPLPHVRASASPGAAR
ncbi:MAG: hypothetical protein IPK97_03550 [Ahniella sp.]|nr:hypothetical protein [Ahniella sp.]